MEGWGGDYFLLIHPDFDKIDIITASAESAVTLCTILLKP